MKQKLKKRRETGCVISRLLFNTYSEEIVQTALAEETVGIKVNGKPINNLRFADDTLMLAESFEDLQRLTDRIVEATKEFQKFENTTI